MEFERELRKLKRQDPWGMKRRKESEREAEKRDRERIGRAIRNIKELEAVAQEQLQPILEIVNGLLLDGEGNIELRTPPKDSRIIEASCSDQVVSLILSWDERSWQRSHYNHYSRQSLHVSVVSTQEAEVKGGSVSSPVIPVINLEGESWEQQFKEALVEILSTPDACYWEGGQLKENRD